MAIKYLRSTDGSDASDGNSWANAYATFNYAVSQMAAGDTLYISQSHTETYTSVSTTITSPGTNDTPCYFICANDAAEPPTALATTAMFDTTSANNFTLAGCFYCYGCTFKVGSATTGGANIYAAAAGTSTVEVQRFEECSFQVLTTGTTGKIYFGVSSSVVINKNLHWKNCTVRFANSNHSIQARRVSLYWEGGGAVAGTSTPNSNGLIIGDNCYAELSGVDLSNFSSTLPIAGADPIDIVVRNCKLPASWTGNLVVGGGPFGGSGRVALFNTDNTDTNYRLSVMDYCGGVYDETTLVRTDGASDGTTPIAWRIAAATRCAFPVNILRSPEIVIWNDTVGSSKTITAEILHDSATALTDSDIWLEVMALTTSGLPLGSWESDRRAILGSTTNHATSSATWTTTGMTNPNKQKIELAVTPAEKGFFVARFAVAKSNYTVYVCPKITVS